MTDSMSFKDPTGQRSDLDGFDLEVTSFDCKYHWIEPDWFNENPPFACPFTPGCGAKRMADCAAAKDYYRICRAPQRPQ